MLPIWGIIAAGTGLYGLVKHLDASDNNREAQNLISDSAEEYKEKYSVLENRQKKLQKSLRKLGKTKIGIQTRQIRKFTSLYGRFKKCCLCRVYSF